MDNETRALISEVADEAARRAINDVFVALGMDHQDPIQMQKDMAWVRDTRVTMEKVGARATMTIVGVIVVGVCLAVWKAMGGPT